MKRQSMVSILNIFFPPKRQDFLVALAAMLRQRTRHEYIEWLAEQFFSSARCSAVIESFWRSHHSIIP